MRTPTSREIVLAGAGLVGVSTAATSAVSLNQLAELCGIPWPLSIALPIALDAGAAVSALVWITEKGELRSWGRGIAIAALVGTLAGNGVQHAITSHLVEVTLPLVLAVGATIPAMLWATVHLAALMVRPATRVTPKTRAQQDARPPAVHAPKTEPKPVAVNEELPPLEWARLNFPVSAKEIQVATGVSRGYSHKLRGIVEAEKTP